MKFVESLTSLGTLAFLGLGAVHCSVDADAVEGSTTRRTALALTVDVKGGTDVGRIRFDVTRVSCAGEEFEPLSRSEVRDLEDVVIPGGIGELEGSPLDADSEHLFSDLFVSLPAGCYDVVTTPLTAAGEPSRDCVGAHESGVLVEEGRTTEIFLINQCSGSDPGSLDAIATLNHEPVLDAVAFTDSKFGPTCEAREICATVSDPDKDPVELVWTVDSELSYAGPEVVRETRGADGSLTQCVTVTPGESGRFDVRVTAYDLVHGPGGELVRVEDFLNDAGYPSPSRAELDFFFYAAGERCVNDIGCADGTREGFVDLAAYPNIAGCSGGFSVPGVQSPTLACGRASGNDSANPTGEGCSAADLCAEGWHVCATSAEVAASSPTGCGGSTRPGDPQLFFATGQAGPGIASCDATGSNDVFGCGNFGGGAASSCAPLNRFSNNGCTLIAPYFQCASGLEEARVVTKNTPAGGGVLCCRD